jgi:hypothetical protein
VSPCNELQEAIIEAKVAYQDIDVVEFSMAIVMIAVIILMIIIFSPIILPVYVWFKIREILGRKVVNKTL